MMIFRLRGWLNKFEPGDSLGKEIKGNNGEDELGCESDASMRCPNLRF